MTSADQKYFALLRDILDNGVEKDSRAGKVKSVFGRQITFDLKEGLPLLTTKKVFTKGIIHELLWFLNADSNRFGMNIRYLVENNVHIWDDDAYRWFKNDIVHLFSTVKEVVVVEEDENGNVVEETNFGIKPGNIEDWLKNITKEEFLDFTMQKVELHMPYFFKYRFGDVGPIYGTQWRNFNGEYIDQINGIIDTLKENPNDRRMLCVAFNPAQLDDMALPPCHVMFQFYTRELSSYERMKIFNDRYMKNEIPQAWFDWIKEYEKEQNIKDGVDVKMPDDGSNYDIADIPKYGLSCMFMMRSNDFMCGAPFNFVQYAILTHMIANIVNMVPDELVYCVGDCHVYMNHMEGIEEQLSRSGSYINPQLAIKGKHDSIEDFKFEDFEIVDYYPDAPIKFNLNVGS